MFLTHKDLSKLLFKYVAAACNFISGHISKVLLSYILCIFAVGLMRQRFLIAILIMVFAL